MIPLVVAITVLVLYYEDNDASVLSDRDLGWGLRENIVVHINIVVYNAENSGSVTIHQF